MLGQLAQPFAHGGDGLVRGRGGQHRRHDPAGLIFGIAEQAGELPLGGRRHVGQKLCLLSAGQVAQRVDRLVGFHPRDQLGRLLGLHLAQEGGQLVRLHLFQDIRGEVVVEAGQQLPPARPAQLFQYVRELGGPQPAQRRVRLAQLHRGRRLRRIGAERLDRGPVDDPVRGRVPAEALGAEPAQQRLQAHVHAHQPDLVADLRQVEVGRPDDLNLVGVHQLVVEDVAVQQHLSLAAPELAQVHPGRPERDRTALHPVDGGGVEEGPAASHPDHDPGQRRVGIGAAMHLGDHVNEAADLLTRLVQHRSADQADQRDDVLPDLTGGHQALRIVAEEVRCGAVAIAGTGAGQSAVEEMPVGHGDLLVRRPGRVV